MIPQNETPPSLTILHVEDNLAHAELVRRSFEEHAITNVIHHVSDGEMALDYLYQRNDFADPKTSPRPNFILLDLRLPRIDGLEVLKTLKADEQLKQIPVVALTTSQAEQDVTHAYSYHVNSYLTKPVDFNTFTRLMEDLGIYWLNYNQNPTFP